MSFLRTILAELSRPDDQGRNWYGWATNQISHAFIGVVGVLVALLFGLPLLWPALAFAAAKEASDLWQVPGWRTARDCLLDAGFFLCGAVIAASIAEHDPVSGVVWATIGAAGLLAGIWSKVRP